MSSCLDRNFYLDNFIEDKKFYISLNWLKMYIYSDCYTCLGFLCAQSGENTLEYRTTFKKKNLLKKVFYEDI